VTPLATSFLTASVTVRTAFLLLQEELGLDPLGTVVDAVG